MSVLKRGTTKVGKTGSKTEDVSSTKFWSSKINATITYAKLNGPVRTGLRTVIIGAAALPTSIIFVPEILAAHIAIQISSNYLKIFTNKWLVPGGQAIKEVVLTKRGKHTIIHLLEVKS